MKEEEGWGHRYTPQRMKNMSFIIYPISSMGRRKRKRGRKGKDILVGI
jgi:hypothetical protein